MFDNDMLLIVIAAYLYKQINPGATDAQALDGVLTDVERVKIRMETVDFSKVTRE